MRYISTFVLKEFSRAFSYDSNKRRVVVTGLGLVCPLGVGVNYVWKKLLKGINCATVLSDEDYKGIPCKVASFVPRGNKCDELDLDSYLKQTNMKSFSLATAYGLIAAAEAISDANWNPQSSHDFEETGVAVGTGMADLLEIVNTGSILNSKGYSKVSPFFVPRILTNMTTGHIAIKYGFKGPNHSVSTACATGLHAIGDAYNFIRNNQASVMICGGVEAVISPISIAAFARMRALTTRFNSDPTKASRPFDRDRDGFVMGEGAGILVLECLQHAIQRKADIYAEVLGYGLSGDAYHITSPATSGNGAYRCMKQALDQSDLETSDVGYINAHATSTPLGDITEVKAIFDLFGNHAKILKVASSKGAIGHLLGAAGSVEAIFTILSCFSNQIPPNVNLENLDIEYDINIVGNQCTKFPEIAHKKRIALKNSFGFGGTNVSIVLSDYKTGSTVV